MRGVVSLSVPRDQVLNGASTVGIHRHGSRYFTALDDGSVEKEIGHGLLVLVDIADR
jgi:hypothetical protein